MDGNRRFDEKKDVVVSIAGIQEASNPRGSNQTVDSPTGYTLLESGSPSNAGLKEVENLKTTTPNPKFATSTSPELIKLTSPATRSPETASDHRLIRRRTVTRSAYWKPKSRLVEPSYHKKDPPSLGGKNSNTSNSKSSYNSTSIPHTPNVPITQRTPLLAPRGGGGGRGGGAAAEEEDDDDDRDVYHGSRIEIPGKKVKIMVLLEWITLLSVMGVLVSTLTVSKLKYYQVWSVDVWKWSVLVMVIFCGRLFTKWFINVLVFSVEQNYLLKKKVLYFVYGLKDSVRVLVWLSIVLLVWELLINHGVERSKETSRILDGITRALVSTLIGAAMWVMKNLLVKISASSFHVEKFFDRIQESIFDQYVLQALSGPPLSENERNGGGGGGGGNGGGRSGGLLSFRKLMRGKGVEKLGVIDVKKLHSMKQGNISAWTMKGLVRVIKSSGLSTISNALDESVYEDGNEQVDDKEIKSEWEARAAACKIFANVAKPGSKYIEEDDLLRFMKREEVDNMLPMFEGAVETRKIKKSTLRNWVVRVYNERRSLAYSLNDTKTAIEELNRILSGIVLLLIVIVWSALMGYATTQVLVFISSQLLLVTFIFGNTCKTVFEAIVFIFVMHPFDVGDRCVIDGVQMVVEEMNILTTVFLRYDNEMIIYPNSVLATKAISNFYRSPEMRDSIEFAIDASTSADKIIALRARVKEYLESKPQHWRPDHSLQVKEIEDINKMKMGITVTHTINFQNYGEKCKRRSELAYELKNIFENLGIKYSLLPQDVHLTYAPGSAAAPTSTNSPH